MTNNRINADVPLTWEQLDEMVEGDPILLRDRAWAEIQRLRREARVKQHELLIRLGDEIGDDNDINAYWQDWLWRKAEEV